MSETIFRRASVESVTAHLGQDDDGYFIRVKRAGVVHTERFEEWSDAEGNWDELLNALGLHPKDFEIVLDEDLHRVKKLSANSSGLFETTENVYRRAAYAISNASQETAGLVRASLLTDRNFCERAEDIIKIASKTTWVDAAIRTLCKQAIAEESKPILEQKQDMTQLPTFGAF